MHRLLKSHIYIHVVCHASYMLRAKFGGNGKIFCGFFLHIAHVLFEMLSIMVYCSFFLNHSATLRTKRTPPWCAAEVGRAPEEQCRKFTSWI